MAPSSRYRIGPFLGEGSFGRVVRAFDRENARWVALKLSDDQARLAQEAEALRLVRHRSVVGYVDSGPGYLAMELVEGAAISEYIRGDLPELSRAELRRNLPMAFGYELQEEGVSAYRCCSELGMARLRKVAVELHQGLCAIHAAGFLHLDVQPDNIRVEQSGSAVLLDLGLAIPMEASVPPEAFAGTPTYLAPELALGRASEESDLYSLGVVLFELLTGKPPFAGGGAEVLVRKQSISAPRACEVVHGIPDDLDSLCASLLSRASSERSFRPIQ